MICLVFLAKSHLVWNIWQFTFFSNFCFSVHDLRRPFYHDFRIGRKKFLTMFYFLSDVCPYGWVHFEDYCYQIRGSDADIRDWQSASIECGAQGGQLAIIYKYSFPPPPQIHIPSSNFLSKKVFSGFRYLFSLGRSFKISSMHVWMPWDTAKSETFILAYSVVRNMLNNPSKTKFFQTFSIFFSATSSADYTWVTSNGGPQPLTSTFGYWPNGSPPRPGIEQECAYFSTYSDPFSKFFVSLSKNGTTLFAQ